MEKCADRSAHAMYKCHTCIVDTDTCFVCCKSHLCSGFQIRAVFICSRQIGKYPFDRGHGKYIGIRCRLFGSVCLYRMCQGIHSGRCGDRLRCCNGKRRIDDRQPWDHLFIRDQLFRIRCGFCHTVKFSCFRSGTCSCRY